MTDLRALRRLARDQGWQFETTSRGHLVWVAPEGQRIVAAGTPSDSRARLNMVAALRRAGLDVPRKAPRRKPSEGTT